MTTTETIEPTETATTPWWRKVSFPNDAAGRISDPAAHQLLDGVEGATVGQVSTAISDVIGIRYWIHADDFDAIQQKLFGASEGAARIGVGTDIVRQQLITEGFGQDDVAAGIRRVCGEGGQDATPHPVITPGEEIEIRAQLRQAANIPEDAGDAATARILAQRSTIRRLENAESELESFKARVVEVADDYAERNDWCAEVDRALGELGLKRKGRRYTATAVVRVRFTATLAERRDTPDEGWIKSSIREQGLVDAIREDFELDNDHTGCEIDYVEIDEVTDVEDED